MDGLGFPRTRIAAVATLATAIGAGLVAVLAVMLGQAIQCFDGDGGSPYVARDSSMGEMCRFGRGVPLFSLPVAAGAVGVVGAVVIVRRWRRAEIGALWLFLALATPSAVPIATFVGVQWAVPTACTGDTADAYADWLASGAEGGPPADCDSY